MPAGFDTAFGRVKALVADFRANEKFYRSPAYQEQEARRDFIDKFWLALGWDVNHETQKNPFEQEVKVERKEHGFSQRRADYAFYLAPNFRDVKFYVEAKKPHGDIATADNYFQTIRYGWSSSTPVASCTILNNSRSWTAVIVRTLTPRSRKTSANTISATTKTRRNSRKSTGSSPAKPSPMAQSKNSPKPCPKNAAGASNAACSEAPSKILTTHFSKTWTNSATNSPAPSK